MSTWNANAFLLKDGTTIFFNDKLEKINTLTENSSGSSTYFGGALLAKRLIIHSPSRTPIKVQGKESFVKSLLKTATIYVPKGSAEAYKEQLPWSNATIIERVPTTGVRLDHENILFSEIGETALLRATVLPEDADNKMLNGSRRTKKLQR